MFIRTKNLLLRPAWGEDAFALTAALGCRAAGRLASAPWPYTVEDAVAFIDGAARRRMPDLLIVEPTVARPAVIGGVGLHERREGHALEFWIAPGYRGRGFASEAVAAMVATARDTMRLDRLVAAHPVGQRAVGHVLRKAGFAATGAASTRHCPAFGRALTYANYRLDLQPAALAA